MKSGRDRPILRLWNTVWVPWRSLFSGLILHWDVWWTSGVVLGQSKLVDHRRAGR